MHSSRFAGVFTERGHRLASPLPDDLPILFPSRRERERALNGRCKNPAYDIYRVRGRLQIPYPVATRFRATASGGGRFSGIYQNANPRSTFRAGGRAVAIPAARVPSSREHRHRYRAPYISYKIPGGRGRDKGGLATNQEATYYFALHLAFSARWLSGFEPASLVLENRNSARARARAIEAVPDRFLFGSKRSPKKRYREATEEARERSCRLRPRGCDLTMARFTWLARGFVSDTDIAAGLSASENSR